MFLCGGVGAETLHDKLKTAFSTCGWESALGNAKILCLILGWLNLQMGNPLIQSASSRVVKLTRGYKGEGSAPLFPLLFKGQLY